NIDVRLTRIVNDFLSINLGLDLQIESYSEDIGILESYIRGNHGENKASSFLRYMKDVTRSFTFNHDAETEEVMRDMLLSDDDGVFINFFPNIISVTYVDLNDRELAYDMGNREVRRIDKNNTPSLFNVAKSLKQHKLEQD